DFIGPKYGWLSNEYIEEFRMIDEDIAPIIQKLLNKKNTTLIITSDHGGHEKIHGSEHPEDYKFPIIIYSDMAGFDDLKDKNYKTSQLRSYLKRVFAK
ncbi:MAG: alkaline phosphatase family protein, partial [Deferribacterales bacterium]